MNLKEFQKYLRRDNEACYHCDAYMETLIPQHRVNRGMGGSKERDRPSNIITFCSVGNGLMESDPEFAELARANGWKLTQYQDPLKEPVYDVQTGKWWRLDDKGQRWLDPYRNR